MESTHHNQQNIKSFPSYFLLNVIYVCKSDFRDTESLYKSKVVSA